MALGRRKGEKKKRKKKSFHREKAELSGGAYL
jgi:hypothetical protein